MSAMRRAAACRRKSLQLATTIRTDNYKDCDFDKSKLLAYSYQYSTKDNSWTEKCKATEVVTNGFTNTGTKGDDVQNPIADSGCCGGRREHPGISVHFRQYV